MCVWVMCEWVSERVSEWASEWVSVSVKEEDGKEEARIQN